MISPLICIFIVGIVQWVEPLGFGVVDAAETSTAPNAIPVSIDHKSAKTDHSILVGIRTSWEATSIDHSADCKRVNRNCRTTFVEDVRSWDDGSAPNWIGAFGGLQGTQHSVANVLNFFVTFDNLRVATTDIRDHESQFDVSFGDRGEPLHFANDELWSVTGNKFFIGNFDCITSQFSLPSRNEYQSDGKGGNHAGSESSYGSGVSLQKLNYLPQEGNQPIQRLPENISQPYKHRGPWFPLIWFFGMLSTPIIAWWVVKTTP